MHSFEQIQTSKMTKESIYSLNHHVLCKSSEKNSVGRSYETLEFFAKEKYSAKFPWKYKINRYGYRGDDWVFKKSPAFFGCSFTFGIGVEYAAPQIVQTKIKKLVPNLGIPGGSAINIIKSFIAFSNFHPIDCAFISLPPISRFYQPVFQYNRWNSFNKLPGFDNQKDDRQIFKMWTNTTDVAYTLDYIDWAETVAKSNNIKICWTSWNTETYNLLLKVGLTNAFQWPRLVLDARDDSHPGQNTHEDLANICLSIIESQTI